MLTNRDKAQMIDTIKKASNEDLGKLARFALRLKDDPFVEGEIKKEKPDVTRSKVIKALTIEINAGRVVAAKTS